MSVFSSFKKNKISKPFIKLVEVSPRDGLQNESKILTIQQRIDLIHNLQSSGFKSIEIGSFVNPKKVPQLANTDLILKGLHKFDNVEYSALIPNFKGYNSIPLNSNLDEIVLFIAASETFNQKNIGCSIQQSLTNYRELAKKAMLDGLKIRASISCCWGCPYEGITRIDTIQSIISSLYSYGVQTIDLADTIGVANPDSTIRLINCIDSIIPKHNLACHFHDSKNIAILNIHAAITQGINTFHSSISGIGGCPFSPNRVGNVSTQKVIELLDKLNLEYDTIDQTKFNHTSKWLNDILSN